MKIVNLNLSNFRNIENIKIFPCEEMNIICGENAQGKTNLLESIWLFTGAKSFRNSKDSDFLKFGCLKTVCDISFFSKGIENSASLEIADHKIAFLNQKKLKTASELAGNFNAIVFSPNDLSLIKDGPAARRKFLNIAIGQIYPSYINLLKHYIRAVTHRNKIIKDYRYDSSLSIMLDIFEEEIVLNGQKIINLRKKYIEKLNNFLPSIYDGLSKGKEILTTEYISCCKNENFAEKLKNSRKEDILSGITSVGPHRDDIDFKINNILVRNFGSQGQKRSVALAVKLSEAEVINNLCGEYPVFLLDDVMSELDPERQNYILNHIKGLQSFLTCCDPSNIKKLQEGKIFIIKNGSVII